MSKEFTIEDLENKLEYHDWYYQYADDYGAFLRGERSRDELMVMIKQFPRDVVRQLWDKHVPESYKNKFDSFYPEIK